MAMTKILFLISSAPTIELADGSHQEAGLFAAQAVKPYDRFTAAGTQVAVATVDGNSPYLARDDTVFHYSDHDQNFLASVIRKCTNGVDNIRVTLDHVAALDLIAARRVFEALKHANVNADEASSLIERTIRQAWFATENFVAVLSGDAAVTEKLSVSQLRECADTVVAEAKRRANEFRQRFWAIPAFEKPMKIGDLSIEEMLEYDAVFVPGGYGPLVDLVDNPAVGHVLEVMHDRSRLIAALAQGPAALLAASYRADGMWLFDSYRMTAITNEETDQTSFGKLGLAWHLEAALKNRGAVFDDASAAWTSHVVIDRNLITGQNPASTDALADAVLNKLGISRRKIRMSVGSDAPPVPQEVSSSQFSGSSQRSARSLALILCERLAARDPEGIDALVQPDAAVDFAPAGISGKFTQFGAGFFRDLIHAFPDLSVKVRSVMGDLESAVIEITVGGTQAAEWLGIHSQKKRVDIDQAWVICAVDGKIASIRAYWCQIQLYRRLAVKRLDQISIRGGPQCPVQTQ